MLVADQALHYIDRSLSNRCSHLKIHLGGSFMFCFRSGREGEIDIVLDWLTARAHYDVCLQYWICWFEESSGSTAFLSAHSRVEGYF